MRKSFIRTLLLSLLLVVSATSAVLTFLPNPSLAQTNVSDRKEKIVYITRTGKKYHRAGCRYLHYSKIKVTKAEAISEGYTACKVCRP